MTRFIPAWAGNTEEGAEALLNSTVHPRVGGEHPGIRADDLIRDGSSPRGRGTRVCGEVVLDHARFIPAWAGNTWSGSWNVIGKPVHPRVGGEHIQDKTPPILVFGSSPRGRGTRAAMYVISIMVRFIPAWAGNTWCAGVDWFGGAVHPRVGGEHEMALEHVEAMAGSSPRGRGTLATFPLHEYAGRFIPAWAGNTGMRSTAAQQCAVHPRVGGEHVRGGNLYKRNRGSSPRGRGTPHQPYTGRSVIRFIPAWAGNTRPALLEAFEGPVHPRVGGEHSRREYLYTAPTGSSPRGRGTPAHSGSPGRQDRFIPAWAGNTSRSTWTRRA